MSDDAYGGNDPVLPHFHPTRSGGGFGAVEHGPHAGLPNRSHVHKDQPGMLPSVPELPGPPLPGLERAPSPPRRRRSGRLFLP